MILSIIHQAVNSISTLCCKHMTGVETGGFKDPQRARYSGLVNWRRASLLVVGMVNHYLYRDILTEFYPPLNSTASVPPIAFACIWANFDTLVRKFGKIFIDESFLEYVLYSVIIVEWLTKEECIAKHAFLPFL